MEEKVLEEENLILSYYNKIKHLRLANSFIQDFNLINHTLNNFEYNYAQEIIDYLVVKYKNDLNTLGKLLTGVIIINKKYIPQKDEEDLINELLYLRDCVILFGAIYCGFEKSIHSAVTKIKNQAPKGNYFYV